MKYKHSVPSWGQGAGVAGPLVKLKNNRNFVNN